MFSPLPFPPTLQLLSPSLLGLEPSQNPWCLILGPNEAQALDVSSQKNSVRDTAIGKRWICSDLERSTRGCGPWRGQVLWHRMWCGYFFPSWVISYVNEWEDHSIIGEPTVDCLGTACHLWVCHIACRLKIKVYLNLTCHLGPI